VVLADDAAALATLDPAEPVLLTRAAQGTLQATSLRLIHPLSPTFSPEFDRQVARILVQLNLGAQRP
jgi:hypothetical protein